MEGENNSKRTTRFSPCVSVCALNEDDVCIGCYRSAEEISRWAEYDDEQVREVLVRTEQRYKQYLER